MKTHNQQDVFRATAAIVLGFSAALLPMQLPSQAQTQAPFMHLGGDWRGMNSNECTGKAVKAMYSKNFIEGSRSGITASGFNENSIVLVYCVPMRDGVYISVISASQNNAEAARLRNEIRELIFNAPSSNGNYLDYFNLDSGAFGGRTRARNYPAMHWGGDWRQMSVPTCSYNAKDAMRKNNLSIQDDGNGDVWGVGGDSVALVSCTPNNNKVYIVVVVASQRSKAAEALRNQIREAVMNRSLFDPGTVLHPVKD